MNRSTMAKGEVTIREPLISSPSLPKKPSYTRCLSHAQDELKNFRSWLRYLCVDQSDTWNMLFSWSIFLLLSFIVPILSHFFVTYKDPTVRAYDLVVQLSLSSASTVSFVCLSNFVHRYGLRRFLFLDKLVGESDRVRRNYSIQLNRSFRILSFFVVPCFVAEAGYKFLLFFSGEERAPTGYSRFMGPAATEALTCILELASWIYRTAIFFFVCILFRLNCFLQILRLEDYAATFQQGPDAGAVLKEHLNIRKQLKIISHRYRSFIVCIVVLVTGSQFVVLFLTTRPRAVLNWSNAGDLGLCSIGLVTGFLMCLRNAAKITHKAQAITSHAATWHVCATIDSFDEDVEDNAVDQRQSNNVYPEFADSGSEDDDVDDDDELDDSKLVSAQFNTISFQKRQSLVTYLENNRAGITVFGFVVDRTWLHALFMIEFSLILWMLGKTVGVS